MEVVLVFYQRPSKNEQDKISQTLKMEGLNLLRKPINYNNLQCLKNDVPIGMATLSFPYVSHSRAGGNLLKE